MFVTLTNVQNGEAVSLQQCIDSQNSQLTVALHSLTKWVGWHNVLSGESFQWHAKGQPLQTVIIPPDLYSFAMLSEHLSDNITVLSVDISKATGYVEMVVPQETEVNFGGNLRHLLGLDDEGWLTEGRYIGDRPVNFYLQSFKFHSAYETLGH